MDLIIVPVEPIGRIKPNIISDKKAVPTKLTHFEPFEFEQRHLLHSSTAQIVPSTRTDSISY